VQHSKDWAFPFSLFPTALYLCLPLFSCTVPFFPPFFMLFCLLFSSDSLASDNNMTPDLSFLFLIQDQDYVSFSYFWRPSPLKCLFPRPRFGMKMLPLLPRSRLIENNSSQCFLSSHPPPLPIAAIRYFGIVDHRDPPLLLELISNLLSSGPKGQLVFPFSFPLRLSVLFSSPQSYCRNSPLNVGVLVLFSYLLNIVFFVSFEVFIVFSPQTARCPTRQPY